MSASRFAPLRKRRNELIELFGAALSANVFANRFMFHPEDLPKIAEESADCFLAFAESNDPEPAYAFGDSVERRGVGDSPLVALFLKLQQFCGSALPGGDTALKRELDGIVERFATSFISGFGEGAPAGVFCAIGR